MRVPLADRMSDLLQNDRAISNRQRNRSACNAEISSVAASSHLLIQLVYFYQSNSGGVIYAADDRGITARWQLGDDCGFPFRQPERGHFLICP